MGKEFEDKWADYNANLREILSSLNILQSAIQNSHNPPENSDIENNIEIIIDKTQKAINNDFIEDELFK